MPMRPSYYAIPLPRGQGALAIMPCPRGGDALLDEMGALRLAGFDVVVSLLADSEIADLDLAEQHTACRTWQMELRRVPIPDMGVPMDSGEAWGAAGAIAADLRAGRNVAIHCRAGIGRSSMVAAATMTGLGFTPKEAFSAISRARGLPVPETPAQLAWVERFAGRG